MTSFTSFVYFIQIKNADGYIKIGYSANLGARLNSLATGMPYTFEVIALLFNETKTTERVIHKFLQKSNVKGDLRGEWFYPSNEVMECIEYVKEQRFQDYIDKRAAAIPYCTYAEEVDPNIIKTPGAIPKKENK